MALLELISPSYVAKQKRRVSVSKGLFRRSFLGNNANSSTSLSNLGFRVWYRRTAERDKAWPITKKKVCHNFQRTGIPPFTDFEPADFMLNAKVKAKRKKDHEPSARYLGSSSLEENKAKSKNPHQPRRA
jgi:hypothetical protein